tara:strand:+ start:120 stop:458 length:339 start_codon:yes stop_codon:yes gene_type:complete
MFRPTQKEALRSLAPTVSYTSQPNGDGTFTILQWDLHSVGVAQPTTEEINTELTRLQTEYDAQDYARAREISYPATKEFIEAYAEKEIGGDSTKWDAYVVKYNKVRSDNPKP